MNELKQLEGKEAEYKVTLPNGEQVVFAGIARQCDRESFQQEPGNAVWFDGHAIDVKEWRIGKEEDGEID